MKESKAINSIERTGQAKVEKKLAYEKPIMKALALFADQVLNVCGKLVSIPGSPCEAAVQLS